ncbi:hypothetical protein BpHYR1_054553 [Brachionus plicatilis]|uniref:Uncharacterized protein n=1 Tax=Brachionus plicatilis TaxID=10195 RepID=A0A3M7SEY5_BRAPC|nr:hypothetical protein BpHYR1_054553 [Brachionus plicatilis]
MVERKQHHRVLHIFGQIVQIGQYDLVVDAIVVVQIGGLVRLFDQVGLFVQQLKMLCLDQTHHRIDQIVLDVRGLVHVRQIQVDQVGGRFVGHGVDGEADGRLANKRIERRAQAHQRLFVVLDVVDQLGLVGIVELDRVVFGRVLQYLVLGHELGAVDQLVCVLHAFQNDQLELFGVGRFFHADALEKGQVRIELVGQRVQVGAERMVFVVEQVHARNGREAFARPHPFGEVVGL